MSTVISVVLRKGGGGKTTTAVNLASALQEKGHKTLLECVVTKKCTDREKERRPSSQEKGSDQMSKQLARRPYPSDVTDAQWELLAPLIPEPGTWSPREPIARREIVNGILYLLRTGCSWRQMPHDLPNGKTVYHYFRKWKRDGTWQQAMSALRKQVRTRMGRDEEPSAAIIDSQSIKTSPVRGRERGFDAGKSATRFAEISTNC